MTRLKTSLATSLASSSAKSHEMDLMRYLTRGPYRLTRIGTCPGLLQLAHRLGGKICGLNDIDATARTVRKQGSGWRPGQEEVHDAAANCDGSDALRRGDGDRRNARCLLRGERCPCRGRIIGSGLRRRGGFARRGRPQLARALH